MNMGKIEISWIAESRLKLQTRDVRAELPTRYRPVRKTTVGTYLWNERVSDPNPLRSWGPQRYKRDNLSSSQLFLGKHLSG